MRGAIWHGADRTMAAVDGAYLLVHGEIDPDPRRPPGAAALRTSVCSGASARVGKNGARSFYERSAVMNRIARSSITRRTHECERGSRVDGRIITDRRDGLSELVHRARDFRHTVGLSLTRGSHSAQATPRTRARRRGQAVGGVGSAARSVPPGGDMAGARRCCPSPEG